MSGIGSSGVGRSGAMEQPRIEIHRLLGDAYSACGQAGCVQRDTAVDGHTASAELAMRFETQMDAAMKSLSIATMAILLFLLLTPTLAARASDNASDNASEELRVSVVLRLVDQAGVEITGSQIGVGSEFIATGGSVDLALGTHVFDLRPGIQGGAQNNRLARSATAEISVG
ncbi:MAG: hypothetical protein HKN13_10290, partial [Rhodothermales bacterium]|nr:hypothetical protein [Rhodothermales bacterium]